MVWYNAPLTHDTPPKIGDVVVVVTVKRKWRRTWCGGRVLCLILVAGHTVGMRTAASELKVRVVSVRMKLYDVVFMS